MIWSIMAKMIRNIPKATATTNTVLSYPRKGSVVIISMGRIQRGFMIFSNPKILPNTKPNIVENTPAVAMIPASGAFLK